MTSIPSSKSARPSPEGQAPQHFLQRLDLFSLLSAQECEVVAKRLKRQDFAPNQPIVREGQPGTSMYVITAGRVEVRRKDPGTRIEFLLRELGPGQCFGEMALLTDKPRSATVVTLENATVGALEREDLRDLLLNHPKIGIALTQILARWLDDATGQVGVDFVRLGKMQFDERLLTLLPRQMMLQNKVIPIAYNNNRLSLAMVDPNNLAALDDVRRVIKGVMIEPLVCTEDDYKRFMTTTYGQIAGKAQKAPQPSGTAAVPTVEAVLAQLQTAGLDQIDTDAEKEIVPEQITELVATADDAPIVRLVNAILSLAIRRGASDVHIEPRNHEVRVRLRVDGLLQLAHVLPKKAQLGLISRLKILAKLDIAERRLPQDGRIAVRVDERPIDFRVSTIPTKWGEKVCMRLLDKSNTALGLDTQILHPATLAKVRDMIAQPHGIIYVTGPTGSGKTTTLYAALSELNQPDVNILTVEDPIEYDLEGASQVQVLREIELDFARALRAFLRQDPDILLVGETRDTETAKTSVEAALTGHLVFTTLHTNDAGSTFTRLREMRVEPFLVSSSTVGVIAQRLARRLCRECREPYDLTSEDKRYWGLPVEKAVRFYRAAGCAKCADTGYKGRVGVYEVLRMTPALRERVVRGESADALRDAAVGEGMLTLKHYGAWLMSEGHTSADEVLQCVVVQE